jgi:hypothetical protein
MLEVDPVTYRRRIAERAINSRWPKIFFDALSQHTNENLVLLAQKMWRKHELDDYSENYDSDNTTGGGERNLVAFKYGIEQSIDYIDWAIKEDDYPDVIALVEAVVNSENAVANFSEIKNQIVFNESILQWKQP